MLFKIFRKDFNTRAFQERSILSSEDKQHRIRLNPLNHVEKIFKSIKVSLIVTKPLVETQNIPEILDHFPNAHAIWIYRNCKDVCSSNLKNFGEEKRNQQFETYRSK